MSTSWAMFWVATKMMKRRIVEFKLDEAKKIHTALKRLMERLDDDEGWATDAYEQCTKALNNASREAALHADANHIRLGKWGEEMAVEHLITQGYVIMERDWRSTHRDIDIVACDEETYVFVEVKTRSNDDLVSPLLAINEEKLNNLRQAINHYIKSNDVQNPVRFDIITVVGPLGSAHPEIEHLKDVSIIK